jgi:hypothetical protein
VPVIDIAVKAGDALQHVSRASALGFPKEDRMGLTYADLKLENLFNKRVLQVSALVEVVP